jgi:hypothetical protein
MTHFSEDEERGLEQHWPTAPAHLLRRERWPWWEQLWTDVIALAVRYRISPARDWRENGTRVEALAALAA